MFRTDKHNNPTAFTTDIADQGGLLIGVDFEEGDSFIANDHIFYTAHLLRDPINLTIKVIDKIGFYTLVGGHMRWIYIGIPRFIWDGLTPNLKKQVIHFMYHREGGTALEYLFV